MKRIVIIGAAGAYTVASADDDMAVKIAAEITSNGMRRLGHQLMVGLELLNKAAAETLADAYKRAWIQVSTAAAGEKNTLETVLELAENKAGVASFISKMQKSIDDAGAAQLTALQTHMETVAGRLGVKPVRIQWTELEKKADKMVPRPTAKVKEKGYRGYSEFITQVPQEERDKYPYSRRDIASSSELQSLINGKRSILEIKNMLDAQYERESKLESVINYIQILKLAGLVEL